MKDSKYYQAKFEYYRTLNMGIVLAACISSIAYFLSDVYLFGEMCYDTLLPRTFILVPMCVYLVVNQLTRDYRVMITLGYVASHSVMWCTIWACNYLTNLEYALVGFIIIQFIFMAQGMIAPVKWALVAHGLLFVDIALASTFIDYPDLAMMYLLGIPLYLGVSFFYVVCDKVYRDQYLIKQQLEESAKHDRMTGAYNRNIMAEITDGDSALLAGKETQLGILLYDLDHFKQINDTYGHATGDEVLIGVSKVFMAGLHEGEYLIRWGGEEFVLILRGPIDELYSRVDDMRKQVEALEFPVGHVSISGGLAAYRGGNYNRTVRAADTAMYQAKNSGRNKIVLYQED